MSRLVTPYNKLYVRFIEKDTYREASSYPDSEVESVCRKYLDSLAEGNGDYFNINQELVFSVLRSLLFKDYKHLQDKVEFSIDRNNELIFLTFNDRMRMSTYPISVWDKSLCILLGCDDDE